MTDTNNTTNGLWETTNQQNILQNTSDTQNQEMIQVLQWYLNNPQMLLGLSQDQITPPAILQQIALNTINTEAQIHAITRIVNDDRNIYPHQFYCQLIERCDMNDSRFRSALPNIFLIIIQWRNIPLSVIEYIFETIRDYWPTNLWLSRIGEVMDILGRMINSKNQNITEIFRGRLEREFANMKSLMGQRSELRRSKIRTETVYTERSNRPGWTYK